MSNAADQEQLIEIKAVVAGLPAEFSLGSDQIGMCLLAPAVDGDGHEVIVRLEPALTYQQQEALAKAPRYYRFLLELLQRAFACIRELQQRLEKYEPPPLPERTERKPMDWARDASILCGKPAFRRFLTEEYGLPANADTNRAAETLRNALKIKSRAELNTDPKARDRWKAFKTKYSRWLGSPQ